MTNLRRETRNFISTVAAALAKLSGKVEAKGFFIIDDFALNSEVMPSPDEADGTTVVVASPAKRREVLLRSAGEAIGSGGGLLHVDGKGDRSIHAGIRDLARCAGREHDLLSLDLSVPYGVRTQSGTLNPFVSGSPADLSGLTVSLMDGLGSDGAMWKERATVMFAGLLAALVWMRDAKGLALDVGTVRDHLPIGKIIGLSDPAAHPDMPTEVRAAVDAYLASLPGFSRDKGAKQDSATLDRHEFLQMVFAQILGPLADEYGHVFLAQDAQIDMKDVVSGRRILLVALPDLEMSPDRMGNLGRIVVASLKVFVDSLGAVAAADCFPRPADAVPSFTAIFDAFELYCMDGTAAMAHCARAAGIVCMFGCSETGATYPEILKELGATSGLPDRIPA